MNMQSQELDPTTTVTRSMSVGIGRAFGTFGELLQGRLQQQDTDFLVTFPIARYAHATFIATQEHTGLEVFPTHKWKSQLLASMILEYYGLPPGGKLTIASSLPVGKGLASSSADLVATARSLSACFGLKMHLNLLQTFMQRIEPSDGVMYPGVVAFYHRQVKLREFLGHLPALTILSIDEGGTLDTIQFNSRPKPFTVQDELEYQRLLDTISSAIRQQNLYLIGQVATRSAILNQKLNPKRTLDAMLTFCEEIQGLGVVVAHSGTCIGLLLSQHSHRYRNQVSRARIFLSSLSERVTIYHSLSF